MADFMSGFWSIYITVLTVLGIAGCALLLWSQSKIKTKLSASGEAESTGHVWDEGLSELNNPMPRWWMWLFYITIVFGVVYLTLYPGLGSFVGKLGWTSAGEYKDELKVADAEYGPLFEKFQKTDLKLLAADPQARAIGERLFLTYCAQCHGSDARGNKGYPNLTDTDWLYGGDPEVIKATLIKGRNGVMPPMGAAIGSEKEIENVAHYVLSLSGSTADPIKAAFGKEKFGVCAACHGADGKGNQALGAPNLTDKTWLYGGSASTIMETIRGGRNNVMPAFHEFLGDGKIHLLTAYIWGKSNISTLQSENK
jgi:cytochrome c oxidase cbb3-type subunit 3